ncbi:MAG: FadR/GntR family transcriptional regulator [Comamonas sp.]
MSPDAPKVRATFQAQVMHQLGQDICDGRYSPGQVLPPESDLCVRFGYSRIVIREAIKSLAAKGMLSVQRRIGTVVQATDDWNLFDPDVIGWRSRLLDQDPGMARDLADLRRIVEPGAARLAALRASAEERRQLRSAYQAMARAVAGQGDYMAADLQFHSVLMAASGNQYVRGLRASMFALLHTSFRAVTWKSDGPAASLPLHEAICVAIEQGDADAAERAAHALIDLAEADLQEQLQTRKS